MTQCICTTHGKGDEDEDDELDFGHDDELDLSVSGITIDGGAAHGAVLTSASPTGDELDFGHDDELDLTEVRTCTVQVPNTYGHRYIDTSSHIVRFLRAVVVGPTLAKTCITARARYFGSRRAKLLLVD